MVCGRSPPSRWSWSSTFGARRTCLESGVVTLLSFQLMRTFTTFDELAGAVGQELGTSEWLTIDQERVDQFADATGDHQWIHVDVERAAQGPFGGTIAHGYLTLSLIPLLGSQVFRLETPGAKLNYGVNKVRFPNPVRVGSRVAQHGLGQGGHRPPLRQAAGARPRRSRSRASRTSPPASPRPSSCSSPDPPGGVELGFRQR